jgi:2-keto-4-pentenoate hydratase
MDERDREAAVALLQDATVTHRALTALPPASKPRDIAEALAIQDRLVAVSGNVVGGWKVATDSAGKVMYGAIYTGDIMPSPASIDSGRFALRGIEVEVAYRFTENLPPRAVPYTREELARILAPVAVIEIVHSRYASYSDTPVLDRLADRMSNGGLLVGEPFGDADITRLGVTLRLGARTVYDAPGRHSRDDPFLPALEFIRSVQQRQGFTAGQIITTGTLTGLVFAAPREQVTATFSSGHTLALTLT